MLGQKDRRQPELFVAGSLRDLLPEEHVLVRVDKVLDLGWLEGEVGDLYSATAGRPGIAPEVAVRLMLAGMLLGIVHDRRLVREAQVNLAIRWFIGYGLHEAVPDHSSLTRIRQRWGGERFRKIFTRTVQACIAAKIAKGEVVHIDSSLIRANVSWEAIARRHVDAVETANHPEEADGPGAGPPATKKTKTEYVCTSDPDATLATNKTGRRSEPAYKHHTAVDAERGVVLDVAITTGAVHDTKAVEAQLDAITATTGVAIQASTMDASYATTYIFAVLEALGIEGVIPAKPERPPKKGVIPVRRFKLDARNRVVRCPAGKLLRPHGKPDSDSFQHYRARPSDCQACRRRTGCFSENMKRRAILLHKNHDALLRARRKYARWADRERALYRSHRIRVEGYHGEAKSWHGMRRAVRRGLANMQIQAYLAAAAVNLKRLAAALILALSSIRAGLSPTASPTMRPQNQPPWPA
ncbi:MAG: IS1182 family transposase [Azospirillaceae bacterium]|nr:IS1182 family transposase [Azospirillaceae bacterium]